jgi:ATP-binding cassette, subfamily A (ABC1), member 3
VSTRGPQGDGNDVPSPREQLSKNFTTDSYKQYFALWVQSGFVQLQTVIDNLILQAETSNANARIRPTVQNVRIPKYYSDEIGKALTGNFSNFVVLPLIVIFLQVVRGILKEKENKTREAMRIMGMSDTSFYLSWIIYYAIIMAVVSALCVSIMRASVFVHSDWSLMFVWHWLFGISVIMQAIFITTFFTNVKLGSIIAMVFYIAMIVINALVSNKGLSVASLTAASLISQNAVSFGADTFLFPETYSQGITWKNLGDQVNNYSVRIAILMTLANILIFTVLALYLDQVIPNEFGKKRHPLLCLMRAKKP